MFFEGPVLSMQPSSDSRPVPCFIVHGDLLENPEMSSLGTAGLNHLGIKSKARSASVADCKSVPSSPQLKQYTQLSNKVMTKEILIASSLHQVLCIIIGTHGI